MVEYKVTMSKVGIEPHKITKPFQLMAVWMAGLVLIVSAFIYGAISLKSPTWLSPMLCIFAFIIVITFAIFIFMMQTKYRRELQEDYYYAKTLEWEKEKFKDFKSEGVMVASGEKAVSIKKNESWEVREQRRIGMYEENHGLFLVHTWRPSRVKGQVADIAISLYQHNEGPLSQGKVKSVEYHLGPMFFKEPVVKTNAKDNFRLDVSAYGPMLCLARVNFSDGTPSLDLERYINF